MKNDEQYRPSLAELKSELKRIRTRKNRRRWSATALTVLTVALFAAGYLSSSRFALLRVNGGSMESTLVAGDVVFCEKGVPVTRGDIVAFEREGILLVKRVIAMEGDQVNITFDGKVYVNGVPIQEGYLAGESQGLGDVIYPVVVPAGQVFVLGDHRAVSVDSRDSSLGMVSLKEVIGSVKALIWPLQRLLWM